MDHERQRERVAVIVNVQRSELAGTGAALAVVPGGTVNLLARILEVDSVESAAAAITTGTTRTIDLGHVDGRAFVLNASSGFDASMIRRVDEGAKRLGRLGYFVRKICSSGTDAGSTSSGPGR